MRITSARGVFAIIATLAITLSSHLSLAQEMDDVEITAEKVADGIYMLLGRGGNIGLSVGNDATFIVDDQFAPLTEKIIAAIAEVSDRPVDYVLNTHWHYDHTGGNENFGERGALIMAHDNVHKRMEAGQTMPSGRVVEPAPDVALPVVTFNDTLTLRVNGQTIKGMHVHHAHTDGDTLVHFQEANVVHMGDTFFKGRFPFIDRSSGGHIDGVIKAAEIVLATGDDDLAIIPGHGSMADKSDLKNYHNMLVTMRDRIQTAIDEGKTLEAIQAENPAADFDDEFGGGFIAADVFVGFVYDSLVNGN